MKLKIGTCVQETHTNNIPKVDHNPTAASGRHLGKWPPENAFWAISSDLSFLGKFSIGLNLKEIKFPTNLVLFILLVGRTVLLQMYNTYV